MRMIEETMRDRERERERERLDPTINLILFLRRITSLPLVEDGRFLP